MDLELGGKTALVTGGSRGIGKAIAWELAREGVDVAIVARDQAANEATAEEIAADTGREVIAFRADTGDDAAVRAMVEAVAAAFGRIDILVNCAAQPAGQSAPPTLPEITDDLFWADMNVKVMGYLRVIREVVPHMKRDGFGRIINVSGMAARMTGSIIGSMRNVSVAAMTKNVADELEATGITATCIHPGLTWTEKSPGVASRRAASLGISEEEAKAQMDGWGLAGHVITAQEVAYLATFLASPKSVSVNGDSIGAGGGARGSIYY
jgi:NAD(P)-dependent dehydrogenase (short-subunit alcohol dehydrogenase family)